MSSVRESLASTSTLDKEALDYWYNQFESDEDDSLFVELHTERVNRLERNLQDLKAFCSVSMQHAIVDRLIEESLDLIERIKL